MRLIFLVGLVVSIGIFLLVAELSRRNVLDRTSFFVGVSASIGLGFFSVMPEFLRLATDIFQLEYTYVLTSTAGIISLLVLNIYTISRLVKTERRLNNLSQEVALND